MQTLIDRFERHLYLQDPELTPSSWVPEEHSFENAGETLSGFLYRPGGDGPFPAVILNHGSGLHQGSSDVSKPSVATLLASWGLACFFPHRRGYGNSTGRPWREQVTAEFGTELYDQQLSERLKDEAQDVLAALAYLEGVSDIDPDRIAVMGSSFGGTVALLAASQSERFRCAVDFAGAAMNWEHTPQLRQTMIDGAKNLTQPICLIQAENDYSTAPTRELARVLEASGKRYQAKVFPPFGANRDEGHLFERAGSIVWGPTVETFLRRFLA